jgi:hypothetical protein
MAHIQITRKAGDVHQVHQTPFAFRAFGQTTTDHGLHQATHREHASIISAAVPKALFVPEKSSGHRAAF